MRERLADIAAAKAKARAALAKAAPSGASAWALEQRNTVVLPAWVQGVPTSHALKWVGGLLVCTKCAAATCTEPEGSLLARPRKGTMPAGSASRLGKLLRGELVYGQAHWPYERSEANQSHLI